MADSALLEPQGPLVPTASARTSKRTENREKRRQQLIDATIRCISKHGIGGTKLADVAKTAGLSQGIVNLHFDSKDNLLAATLRYLADEYRQQFEQAIGRAGPGPADRIRALIEMDFRPSICDRKKLAVWFAFWGEAKAVPTYRKICQQRDREYGEVLEQLCRELVAEGGYDETDPVLVASALAAITDGLWLSCLISPGDFDRGQAKAAVENYLRAVFPRHFSD